MRGVNERKRDIEEMGEKRGRELLSFFISFVIAIIILQAL